jgi:hypothetical protein
MAAAIAAVEQERPAVRQQSAQFLLEVLSAMPESPQADAALARGIKVSWVVHRNDMLLPNVARSSFHPSNRSCKP